MSTDNQHSTPPVSKPKTSWVSYRLKYIAERTVAIADSDMRQIKAILESHIYVLAVLSTRGTDLSAYVADVQSAYNACVSSIICAPC